VMYDDLNAPHDNADPGLEYQPPRSKANETGRAPAHNMQDREVPLPSGGATSVLHQWLDGDVSVGVVRATQGGNDAVDLWTKIHDEAETLRSRTTPLYVHKRIMDSLPEDQYRGHHPWYKRSIAMNPAVLVAGAVALLGIGILIAQTAFR
jgi:hypothetical protein